jgi:hypothetical protein
MTQVHHSPARYDDEVLRFWAQQANQLQAAYDALWHYLDPSALVSFREKT